MTSTWPDANQFWAAKRVLVTGGAGFLGSFVVKEIRRRGAKEVSSRGAGNTTSRRRRRSGGSTGMQIRTW